MGFLSQVCLLLLICAFVLPHPHFDGFGTTDCQGKLGCDPCNDGPVYWCSSPRHAEECNAEKQCKELVQKSLEYSFGTWIQEYVKTFDLQDLLEMEKEACQIFAKCRTYMTNMYEART